MRHQGPDAQAAVRRRRDVGKAGQPVDRHDRLGQRLPAATSRHDEVRATGDDPGPGPSSARRRSASSSVPGAWNVRPGAATAT